MRIIGIAAVAQNGIIGKDGKLPWHLPNDLKHFKETTRSHWVIMGHTTYKHLGKPLPNRSNIVIASGSFNSTNVTQATNIEESLEIALYEGAEKVFVCGGAYTYKKAESYIQEWDLTIIHADVDGDAYFPIDLNTLELISNEDHPIDEKHQYPYSFRIYRPKSID